jgi:hypothetical protein
VVGTNRQHENIGVRKQLLYVVRAALVGPLSRKHLLELVDHSESSGAGRRTVVTVALMSWHGKRDPPLLTARQSTGTQCRDETGSLQGRLSASRGADKRHDPSAGEPRYQLAQRPLPSEEELGVVSFEGGEPGVRARVAVSRE